MEDLNFKLCVRVCMCVAWCVYVCGMRLRARTGVKAGVRMKHTNVLQLCRTQHTSSGA